jgi:flagellar basal-body rod protein FlgC
MKKAFIIIILLFFEVAILNSQGIDIFQKYANENNIPIILGQESITIYESISNDDLDKFFNLLFLKAGIILDNIANINTTRTAAGGPYKRKYIRIIDGEIILGESFGDFPLRYNPSHPDAIMEGARKGYVEFPNIDIIPEFVDFITVINILKETINSGKNINIVNESLYDELKVKINTSVITLIDIIDNEEPNKNNEFLRNHLFEMIY